MDNLVGYNAELLLKHRAQDVLNSLLLFSSRKETVFYQSHWTVFNAIRLAVKQSKKSPTNLLAAFCKNNFSFFFGFFGKINQLLSEREDLQPALSYLAEKNLSIFVSSWSEELLAQVAEDLSEEEFLKLWELLLILRHFYDQLFYFHFHRIAREKFLLRRLGFYIKF